MMDDADWTRLARYVAGECTPDEAEELRRWIESDPERQQAVVFMREVDTAAVEHQPQWDTAASWKHLTARASARARRPVLIPYADTPRRTSRWRRVSRLPLRAAAVLALAASGSLLWLAYSQRDGADAGAPEWVAAREYATTRGERATLRLPDGTNVTLNVATTLRVPESYGRGGRRDVYLEGEAHFDVQHDTKRRFLVHTATAVTEDLGTKFGVRAYDSDSAIQVVVTEGSVELRPKQLPPDRRGTLLVAGQVAQLEPSGETRVRSDLDVDRYLAWMEGRLVFDDAPFGEVLPQLGRWYDLEFELADSTLATRTITASFGSEAVSETLKLLASTIDAEYELSGRTVSFRRAQ